MSVISTNLFNEILANPFNEGANKLLIVSGYATANMVARHVAYLKSVSTQKLTVELIVGMCVQDGLEIQNHESFKEIQKREEVNFKCQYVINRPAIHSKLYIWLKNDVPYKSFIGSANYTQNAFSQSMREIVSETNPALALDYYNEILGETINCDDDETIASSNIELYTRKRIIKDFTAPETAPSVYYDLPKVTLTLLDGNGKVPEKSGLNWGQRPNRNHNEAYLNVPSVIGRTDFFPSVGTTFFVETDDNKQLICVRAQQNGKGIHTTFRNADLGEYFRYRLELASGEMVTVEDLLRYGRTNVDFYKIDEESYLMDFSV